MRGLWLSYHKGAKIKMYDDIVIDEEYEIERQTNHGYYVAVVKIEKGTRKQFIELYRRAKETPKIFNLFKLDRVLIADRVIDKYGDVGNAITRLIIDWELPLYQKAKAKESGHYLDIDYEKELKKRRERLRLQEEEAIAVKEKKEIPIHDWMDEILQKQMQTKPKKRMTIPQLRNLPQYRNLTDEEILMRINRK